jgi:hypothetical protein
MLLEETTATGLAGVHASSTTSSLATAVSGHATAAAAVTHATNTLATIAAMAGHSLTLTTNHGEADEREEDRNAQDQNTIHAKPPKSTLRKLMLPSFAQPPRRRHPLEEQLQFAHKRAHERNTSPM